MRTLTGIFLALGLLLTKPVFASDDLEALIKAGDHRKLEMYHLEEAKNLKAKAEKWEVLPNTTKSFWTSVPSGAGTCTSLSRMSVPSRMIIGKPCMKLVIWPPDITY